MIRFDFTTRNDRFFLQRLTCVEVNQGRTLTLEYTELGFLTPCRPFRNSFKPFLRVELLIVLLSLFSNVFLCWNLVFPTAFNVSCLKSSHSYCSFRVLKYTGPFSIAKSAKIKQTLQTSVPPWLTLKFIPKEVDTFFTVIFGHIRTQRRAIFNISNYLKIEKTYTE